MVMATKSSTKKTTKQKHDLVYIMSNSCGWCKKADPIVSELKGDGYDITTLDVDCIVNAANEDLMQGGGVSGAIHQVAGKELALKCKRIGHCGVGEARITKGYNLKANHIIHGKSAIWVPKQNLPAPFNYKDGFN